MLSALHYSKVLESLKKGAMIITPNNRLTKMLMDKYLSHMQVAAIPQPLCLSYDNLLQSLYSRLLHETPHHPHPLLLNNYQIYYLWKQILSKEGQNNHQGFLEQVIQAWDYCQLWEINPQKNAAFSTLPTTHRFSYWSHIFQDFLNTHQLICPEQLVPYLMQHTISAPSHKIIWLCFDSYTPQQRALQNYFAQEGSAVHSMDLPKNPTNNYMFAAEDQDHELQSIIIWAKKKCWHQQQLRKNTDIASDTVKFSAREMNSMNQERFAVVIPDLNQRAHQIDRLLQQHFTEDQYNISLGNHLADYAIVSHALCCLSLSTNRISNVQARLLVNSPFIAQARIEASQRLECLLDNYLILDNFFSLQDFSHSIQQAAPLLAKLLSTISPYPKAASPTQWVELFQARLAMLGFPGEYLLDSANYQCYQRFLSSFDEFKKLQVITKQLNCSEALSSLTHLAQTTIFQPEKNASAPIQVLGLLEASGCEFESIWIAGMTEQCLPQKTQFSPFIPLEIQKEQGLPYTDPDREFLLAEQTVQRFQNAGSEIIWSYPLHTDGQQNLPSPLMIMINSEPYITTYTETPPSKPPIVHTYQDNCPMPPPNSILSASTSLLAHQAQCPFRAFAAHRLAARGPANNQDGLSLKERGILLHHALELFWKNVHNQQQLCAMSDNELTTLIQTVIQKALQPYAKVHRASFPPLLQEIEADRLQQLIENMIIWEKNRPEFTIYALEKPYELTLANIHFKIRVDRIDQLATGEKWVIDYKSSLPSPLPWNEDIPTEPQILLYALIDNQVNTLLFAQLKKGQFITKGLSDTDYNLTGVKTLKDTSWNEQNSGWHKKLTDLADKFYQGNAVAQPKNVSLCKTCDYSELCRTSFKN